MYQFPLAHLVSLSETINPPHFSLLVRIREDTHCGLFSRDGEDKVFTTLLSNVLPQFAQQPRGPLLLHLRFLSLEKKYPCLRDLVKYSGLGKELFGIKLNSRYFNLTLPLHVNG